MLGTGGGVEGIEVVVEVVLEVVLVRAISTLR